MARGAYKQHQRSYQSSFVAINAERDKQNEGVRKSVNKTNTKVYLTDSSTKVMNSSKPFRNQAE
nr:hypothetical protein [uncultured Prevotella sp.]